MRRRHDFKLKRFKVCLPGPYQHTPTRYQNEDLVVYVDLDLEEAQDKGEDNLSFPCRKALKDAW